MEEIRMKAELLNELVLTGRREDILKISQELDLLIVKYMKHEIKQKNSIKCYFFI